ncbi:hypothetical protein [Arthrobacter sp. zg-Y877]|uniref:hypothetical protein n=1 Tax=Arthrobacter sp. zg-Y877 TaxID=3049074 RepID=UPI0025A3FCA6|nr:hypothetical protein [Arthrobacter sp. zg-Y877]MDM7990820.1 hypothetical protein [Arthrobacter sp. zg-Y877]
MSSAPPDEVRSPMSAARKQPAEDPTPDSPPSPRPGTLRRAAGVLAGALALFGLGTLGAVLVLSLQSQQVAPWLVAASLYALPAAFLLLAGLVIDGIRRRRRD